MNKSFLQRGIGLIEVLVAMVIIAVGLLAVAQLQTSVTSESRVNKTRSEATNLCEQLIASYRQPLALADFASLATGTVSSSTLGTVETYNTTLNVTGDSTSKNITATCAWADGSITLSTLVAPHTAVAAVLGSDVEGSGGSSLSPSLNANSSIDIKEQVNIVDVDGLLKEIEDQNRGKGDIVAINQGDEIFYRVDDIDKTKATKIYLCEDLVTYPILNSDYGLRAQRVDINTSQKGLEGIRLYESFRDNVRGDGTGGTRTLCEAKVLYRGGVILPISGQVHSRVKSGNSYLEVDFLTFDISESGTYCAFDADPSDTSASYICYLGGNCEYGPFTRDNTAGTNFFQCPEVPSDIVDADSFDMNFDVGPGGWRGKIGLLDVANQGYNVCFNEEISGQESTRDTAREYKAITGTLTNASAQGINKPYQCHDFMIIDGVKNPNHIALRKACSAASEDLIGETLSPKLITRELPENSNNDYDSVIDIFFCGNITTKFANGIITNRGQFIPYVTATDGANIAICSVTINPSNNTQALYACEIQTEASDLQIQAKLTPTVVVPDPGCTVSAAVSSNNTNGCTIDLSTASIGSTVSNTITGTINATNEGYTNFSTEGGGMDSLAIIYDDLELGCELGTWSSPKRNFLCAFLTDSPIASGSEVSFFADSIDGYTLTPDYINDDAAIASAAITSFPSLRSDFDLVLSSDNTPPSTRTLSGSIRLNDDLDISNFDVNPSDSSDCILNPSKTGYSCLIPTTSIDVTFSGGNCDNLQPKRKIVTTLSGDFTDTATSLTGAITVTVNSGSNDVTINIEFSKLASGNCK